MSKMSDQYIELLNKQADEELSVCGFPSRPTGGGRMPRDFKLLKHEVATPKLDGHRLLVNPTTDQFMNRKNEPYTYITEEQKLHVVGALCRVVDSMPPAWWWDLEFIPHGRDAGKFMILDCIPLGANETYMDPMYYHARRALYADHFPEACVRSNLRLCTREEYAQYMESGEWYSNRKGKCGEKGVITQPAHPTMAFVPPVFNTTQGTRACYWNMQEDYSATELMNDVMETEHKCIWEGMVVKHTASPYCLTRKQSQNRHLEVKYRFDQ